MRGLLNKMIGQEEMRYCKLRLTTKFFDFVADSKWDIVVYEARTFVKRFEVSCAIPITSKDPMHHFESS